MTDTSNIWTGKASNYDLARPAPPPVLPDLLTQMIATPHPSLVVDLGSGTGLSTVIWAEKARHVIGIEPNDDMRAEATHKSEQHSATAHIEYQAGMAHQTDLPDVCADIVTAAQSFHWMEPTSTLTEIARILRTGGLFAAYDYDSPPTIHWELDQLVHEANIRLIEFVRTRGLTHTIKIWPQNKSLAPLRESHLFRFTLEVFLHHVEQGDVTRFLRMMHSGAFSGQFQITDQELGLDRLAQVAFKYIGPTPIPWYWSYHVRIGIK
jgi:ubiquinone/menaquinone biosynthesis C-methylase UbiE